MTVYLRALVPGLGVQKDVAAPFRYPGGELHLKDVAGHDSSDVVWIADVRGASLDDLGYAAMLAGVAHQRAAPFALFLPYLPAARSDKVGYLGDPLGVKVYADLVNSMNPQQVVGIDAHSPVVHRYLRNLTELDLVPLVRRAVLCPDGKGGEQPFPYEAVIAPDEGAMTRAGKVAEAFGVPLLTATKKRDLETGKILGVEPPPEAVSWGHYLVVDDICDGGGTFMGLAQAIGMRDGRRSTYKPGLGLWVTHGIFSGNAQLLRDHYDDVYTTDSHPGHGNVGVAATVVPVESYMYQNLKEFG